MSENTQTRTRQPGYSNYLFHTYKLLQKQTFDGANVDSFDAHQVRKLFKDDCPVCAIVFVDTADLTFYPVSPV